MADSVVTRINNLLPMLHSDTRAALHAWTDAFLVREFHDGLREICRTSGIFVKRVNGFIRLRQGVALYGLPKDLLSLIRVAVSGVPLIPSSQPELQSLDEALFITQGTPQYWYHDRTFHTNIISARNELGIYPVPNAASDQLFVDLIYHYTPCVFDEGHTADTIDAPLILGDMLELRTLAEAYYSAETDMSMPETAQAAKQAVEQLYRPNFFTYYGESE